ncbi:hypothetical protein PDIG_51100 [Penicillium digitatum PHI26]|uniref:Uncharacterized protein n=2 Tax=Penicillium digitatum TaxID=36651 RepID=K9FQ17_PEND2|nr:hypothetical protein PDIP_20320 [Penicillium digitatum Pd1]EKV11274.1 hypothetical protein PDIG_51100 [Penicillium digitatum PHI26]EKV20049.1 hypothetical protein PDIP_20320 [Penicillium digitatum Pd1]
MTNYRILRSTSRKKFANSTPPPKPSLTPYISLIPARALPGTA